MLTAVLSRATGRLADVPVPRPLRGPVLGGAARLLGMDLAEAEAPVEAHRSLGELFARRLKGGVRRWPASPAAPGSPVDGVVGRCGPVVEGRALQAKGRAYSVAELLDDVGLAERFGSGTYVTLYLAPRHYHRIHAPVRGRLRQARHIPGRLLPVNAPVVRMVDRLFPRNERLIALLEPGDGGEGAGPEGPGALAVVAIGAFNVGRISADFDAELVTNRWRARAETRLYHPPVEVERGQPLMAFHLGSTVVLLFERAVALAPGLWAGSEIRLGESLVG